MQNHAYMSRTETCLCTNRSGDSPTNAIKDVGSTRAGRPYNKLTWRRHALQQLPTGLCRHCMLIQLEVKVHTSCMCYSSTNKAIYANQPMCPTNQIWLSVWTMNYKSGSLSTTAANADNCFRCITTIRRRVYPQYRRAATAKKCYEEINWLLVHIGTWIPFVTRTVSKHENTRQTNSSDVHIGDKSDGLQQRRKDWMTGAILADQTRYICFVTD